MKKISSSRRSRSQRGQGLVEMGIVVLLMVSLTMGIVEMGRIFMILNMVTNATRDAARAAAAMGKGDRSAANAQLCATAAGNVKAMVVNQMNGYITIAPTDVAVDYPPVVGGAPRTVVVRTDVTVPYIALFAFTKFWGKTLHIIRSVTFRDEITAGGTGC